MAKRETAAAATRQAPAAAAAIVDFLNSRPHASPAFPDALAGGPEAARVLQPFSPGGEPTPSDDDLRRLRELRADLMAVAAPADPLTEREAWERVSRHAARAPFRYRFLFPGGGGAEVRAEPADGDQVTSNIIRSVAELISSGDWSRIKACANPACAHVFYDATRSRTQRWDSYEVCGNRANVAAYRSRRAQDPPAGSGE